MTLLDGGQGGPAAPLTLGDFFPWFKLDRLAPHLFPTQGRLKHLLRMRTRNGLAPHLTWVGREPFITEAALRAWLESRREPVGA